MANLQPTKMSHQQLGTPDAHVPPSLNKGARPQKRVIVSSYLGSGGPNVIFSFTYFYIPRASKTQKKVGPVKKN